jgi:hypothetical protein
MDDLLQTLRFVCTLPNSCTKPAYLLNFNTPSKSPEDAGRSPMLATTFEEGESLTQLFEYTVPD